MDLEPETRRKIEDMVMDLLKQSNIEETTEFSIRVAASERLGIDLSDPNRKHFVRNVVESYLRTVAAEDATVAAEQKPPELIAPPEEPIEAALQLPKPSTEVKDDCDQVIFQLSNKRNVVVKKFKGTTLVSIREFFQKDGKQIPTSKGISLSSEQWSTFKKNVPAIEEAITKLEGKMKSELHDKQNGDAYNSVVDVAPPLEHVPVEVSRFDGKNYQLWAQQMESLLKQLKIDYVLTELSPNAVLGENSSAEEIARTKNAERRWVNDDLMCRRNILTHLSDSLFCLYANRKMSAKELWEDLKLVYLYEEHGSKRVQVKKYLEFQMVDERPIVEQIQEFNSIADSLVAAGMFLDENFHASAIISKLPPSWKDFCIKSMREEYLPLWRLIDCIRMEEESRNGFKRVGEPYSRIGFNHSNKGGPRESDNKFMHRNKSESNGKSIACYICGKKGHLSKHCWRRYDKQGNERKAEDVCIPQEVNMVGGC
ncbi:hypothetical protein HN51_014453 [Arachis hypogaea]|uniref:Uncharacterized protein n=1 Tax=Arachis hypogaea TaxID=3818 RepID=A0A445CPF9_ARAHY|nr:uncharacterized protein LOC112695305 [Arachis hypogaea]RYR52807.1 hypothetical protein Ahy_A06g027675 [Arachis hypogaea]